MASDPVAYSVLIQTLLPWFVGNYCPPAFLLGVLLELHILPPSFVNVTWGVAPDLFQGSDIYIYGFAYYIHTDDSKPLFPT